MLNSAQNYGRAYERTVCCCNRRISAGYSMITTLSRGYRHAAKDFCSYMRAHTWNDALGHIYEFRLDFTIVQAFHCETIK